VDKVFRVDSATKIAGLIFIVAAALVASAVADGEDQPEKRPVGETSFGDEVEVTVANLDIFVRDREGRPVEGLTAEDFRIIQDCVEMEISNFAAFSPKTRETGSRAGERGAADLAAETTLSLNEPAYVVLHIDNENLHAIDRKRVLTRVRSFVEETLVSGVQMMVVSSRRSLEIRQPFTADPDAVLGALQRVANESGARIVRDRERRRIFDDMERWAGDATRMSFADLINSLEARVFMAEVRGRILAYTEEESGVLKDTLAGMHEVVRLVTGLEGRRSIVYVSNGLPMVPGLGLMHEYATVFWDNTIYSRVAQRDYTQEFRALADAANREGVSLYTIDASGLNPLEGFGAEDPYVPEARASWVDVSNRQEPLRFMADETGGLAVLSTNDVTAGLRLIRDDLFSYYSVGYSISPIDVDTAHRIEVELPRHPDHDVRYRKWFVEKSFETRVRERVLQMLVGDLEHNPLDLRLTLGDPAPVTGKRWEVPIRLSIPINSLALEVESGDLVSQIELYFCVRDALGQGSPTQRREYEIRVPAAQFEPDRVQRYAILVQMLFKEQRHTVAVGLVDRVNHQTSYARTVVDIP
jgi:VWFA-related protein